MKKFTLPLALLLGSMIFVSCDSQEAAQEKLIKSGVIHSVLDINNPEGQAAFMEAIRQKNYDIVSTFIRAGIDLKAPPVADALLLCQKRGDTKMFELLLEGGASVNCYGSSGIPLLEMAVWENNAELVDKLLSLNAAVDIHDSGTWSPLMAACGPRDFSDDPNSNRIICHSPLAELKFWGIRDTKLQADIADKLLKAGAEVNHVSLSDGWNPLALAAYAGRNKMVKKLLEHKASINPTKGVQPLAAAVANKQEKTIKLLLQKGADVNAKGRGFETPLAEAVKKGDLLTAELLLQHGADPNIGDEISGTPVFIAVKMSDADMAQLLLEHGAKPISGTGKDIIKEALNHQDALLRLLVQHHAKCQNDDLLVDAFTKGTPDSADYLLQAGASMNVEDYMKRNLLQILIRRYIRSREERDEVELSIADCRGFIDALKKQGFSPAKTSTQLSQNLLNEAISESEFKDKIDIAPLVELMLNEGFPLPQPAESESEMLFNCINILHHDKNVGVVKVLAEHGANINARNRTGESLLERAFRHKNYATAQLLLDKGCDRVSCSSEQTPLLHILVERDDERAVEMLLKAGADVNIRDKRGYRVADGYCSLEMQELLQRYGAKKGKK